MVGPGVADLQDPFMEEMRQHWQYSWLSERPQYTTLLVQELRKSSALRSFYPVGLVAERIAKQIPALAMASWIDLADRSPMVTVHDEPDKRALAVYQGWESDDSYTPQPAEPTWSFEVEMADESVQLLHLTNRDAQSLGVRWQYYWQEAGSTLWAVPSLTGWNGYPLRKKWDGSRVLSMTEKGRQLEHYILSLMSFDRPVPLVIDQSDLRLLNLVELGDGWHPESLCEHFGLKSRGYGAAIEIEARVDLAYQAHLLLYQSDLDRALECLQHRREEAISRAIECLD